MTFTVPGRLPGYNELAKGHWRRCHRVKKAAMEAVMWAARAAGVKPCLGRATVTIRCYEPSRRRDQDNVTDGASKVVLDALVGMGILKGDGAKHVEYAPQPVRYDRASPRVEVAIAETGGDKNKTITGGK